jgi:exonuclease SbcC
VRLNHIRVRGLDPYIEENFVDIAELPGPLVAVIGGNGEGKSTLLNFFPAATVALNKKFLKMPKPDGRPLADLSVAKDSFLEIGYHFGQDYIVRHSINGLNGKTDCSVTNGDGQALLKGKAGSTEFLGWAAEHSLPPEVFFGSVFSSQGTHGMLGMDPAERKAVILRVIGLERYEKLAKAARDKRSECDKQLAIASGKLQELQGDAVEMCEQRLLRLTDEKRTADETLRLGELTLKELQAKNDAIKKQQAEYNSLVTRRAELESQEAKLASRISELDTLIQNNSGLLETADEIRAAVTRMAEIDAELKKCDSIVTTKAIRQTELDGEGRAILREADALSARHAELQKILFDTNTTMAGYNPAKESADRVPTLENVLEVANVKVVDLDEAINQAQEVLVGGKDGRILSLRTGLEHVRDGEDPSLGPTIADSVIKDDDNVENETSAAPARIAELRIERGVAQSELAAARIQLERTRALAATLPQIETAKAENAKAIEDSVFLDLGEKALADRDAAHQKQQQSLTAELGIIKGNARQLEIEAEPLRRLAGRAAPLAEAKIKIAAYQQERVKIDNDREGVLELLSKVITDAVEPPKLLNLSDYEAAVSQAGGAVGQVMAQLAVARDALTRATAQEARRVELQEEVKVLGRDMADWKRLADDLGKDGVQALSVDAAAPELTTLANDLLQASGDTRFSLKISTTRMDSKGKRELEGFEIEITDSRKQGTKTGGSGGEESYLNKALAFSLTMMACRHMGLDKPTIVDDEGDAALSVEYAPGYVLMLRRAAELMDASKVLFVTHRPDSWNMADSRLEISAGAISVT